MIGEQARDSLLLCMSISKNNDKIADYITSKSNICPVRKFRIMKEYVSSIPIRLDGRKKTFYLNSGP